MASGKRTVVAFCMGGSGKWEKENHLLGWVLFIYLFIPTLFISFCQFDTNWKKGNLWEILLLD